VCDGIEESCVEFVSVYEFACMCVCMYVCVCLCVWCVCVHLSVRVYASFCVNAHSL